MTLYGIYFLLIFFKDRNIKRDESNQLPTGAVAAYPSFLGVRVKEMTNMKYPQELRTRLRGGG